MTEIEMQKKALEAAGSWMRSHLIWEECPEDGENWCIIHTCHRDSAPHETRRGRKVERQMERFTAGKNPSAKITRFNHWAVGWVDAVAVRVFKNRDKMELTPAFKKLCSLNEKEAEDAE